MLLLLLLLDVFISINRIDLVICSMAPFPLSFCLKRINITLTGSVYQHEQKQSYLLAPSLPTWASRAVQWLRLSLAMQRAQVRSPGQGTKIPHARWFGHKFKKRRKRLRAFNEGGLGWIPGRGTKILHVLHWGQQKTNKQKMGIIAAPVSQGFQNA